MESPNNDTPHRNEDGYFTAYGQQGVAGAYWHTILTDSCVQTERYSPKVHISDGLWKFSVAINNVTIMIYQIAASDALLDTLTSLVEDMVTWLREGIFAPLLSTAIILGAVWLAWVGLIRRRATLTLEGTIWMILSTALGIWVMANPGSILGLSSTLANGTGKLVHEALSEADPGGYRCPKSAQSDRPDHAQPTPPDEELELTPTQANSELLYSGLICQPWQAGIFGTSDRADQAAAEYGEETLRAQAFTSSELADVEESDNPEDTYNELVEEKNADYENVDEQIESDYPELYPLWSGQDQDARIGTALLALTGAFLAGALIFLIALSLIVLKIFFLLLLMLAPVFFLVGVHPGMGRNVLTRWFEAILGVWLKQAFLILLMAILVIVYGQIMALSLSWGWKVALLAATLAAVITGRKKLATMFMTDPSTVMGRAMNSAATDDTLGNVTRWQPPVAMARFQKKGAKKVIGLATAAATGGATAAAGAGAAAGAATRTKGRGGNGGDDGGSTPPAGSDSPPSTPPTPHTGRRGTPPPLQLDNKKTRLPSGAEPHQPARPSRPTSAPSPSHTPSSGSSEQPASATDEHRRAADQIAARGALHTRKRHTDTTTRSDPPPRRVQVDETIVVRHEHLHRGQTRDDTPEQRSAEPRRVQRPLTRIHRRDQR